MILSRRGRGDRRMAVGEQRDRMGRMRSRRRRRRTRTTTTTTTWRRSGKASPSEAGGHDERRRLQLHGVPRIVVPQRTRANARANPTVLGMVF